MMYESLFQVQVRFYYTKGSCILKTFPLPNVINATQVEHFPNDSNGLGTAS